MSVYYFFSKLYFIVLDLSHWNTFEINIAKFRKQVKFDTYDRLVLWCFNATFKNILVRGKFYYLEKPTDLPQVIDTFNIYDSYILLLAIII